MGCFESKESPTDPKPKKGAKGGNVGMKMSWDRQQKTNLSHDKPTFEQSRDPADYRAEKLKGETFIRLPGQINDQRINIEDCHDCLFYLVDQSDSIQIDDCTNCKFFIAPSMSSVFIRNCKDCNFIVACGQLRTRDIKRCNFSLYCQSRPCIESSSNIGIGCFYTPGYFQLSEQFAKAHLSTFSNLYTNVHDFTPKDGNFHFINQHVIRNDDFMPPLDQHTDGYITADELAVMKETPVVPYTHGSQSHDYGFVTCILFRPGCLDECEELLLLLDKQYTAAEEFSSSGNEDNEAEHLLLHCNEHRYTEQSVNTAGSELGLNLKIVKAMKNNPCVAVAFAHRGLEPTVLAEWTTNLTADRAANAMLWKHSGPKSGAEKYIELLFEKLPMQGMAFGATH